MDCDSYSIGCAIERRQWSLVASQSETVKEKHTCVQKTASIYLLTHTKRMLVLSFPQRRYAPLMKNQSPHPSQKVRTIVVAPRLVDMLRF